MRRFAGLSGTLILISFLCLFALPLARAATSHRDHERDHPHGRSAGELAVAFGNL